MLKINCHLPQILSSSYEASNNISYDNHIDITNQYDKELEQLTIKFKCNPEIIVIDSIFFEGRIKSNEKISLKPTIHYSSSYFDITDVTDISVTIEIEDKHKMMRQYAYCNLSAMPYNYWDSNYIELLASFITVDNEVISSVLNRAAHYMYRWTKNDKISGYLYDIPKRPKLFFSAIKHSLSELSIYRHSAETTIESQYIKLGDQIHKQKICSELELALFFASCLYAAKLNPVICLLKDTVYVGCWSIKINLLSPIISHKDEIQDFLINSNGDIEWFYMDGIFRNPAYNDNQDTNTLLETHLNNIQYIIDVKAVKNNGIRTILLPSHNNTDIDNPTPYDTCKYNYADILNKYSFERRKNISSLRYNTIYLEILSEIYQRWLLLENHSEDGMIMEYLCKYPYHSGILSEIEFKVLYKFRIEVLGHIIAKLFSPNIKYATFVKEEFNIRETDDILLYNDEESGFISIISGACNSLKVIVDNTEAIVCYQILGYFKKLNRFSIESIECQSMDGKYDKMIIVIGKHTNYNEIIEYYYNLNLLSKNGEIILSISESVYNEVCNILLKYKYNISDICFIPIPIASKNEGKYIVRITNKKNSSITMTDGFLVPPTSFIEAMAKSRKVEDIVSKKISLKTIEEYYKNVNPLIPSVWTIPYTKYHRLIDIATSLIPLSVNAKDSSMKFITVDTLLSNSTLNNKRYIYNVCNNDFEGNKQCDYIDSKFFRIDKDSILLYPIEKNYAYRYESYNRMVSDKHILNYKVIIIKNLTAYNPLIIKDDKQILLLEPKNSIHLDFITEIINTDIFFAKQLNIYQHSYTTDQLRMRLDSLIIPYMKDKNISIQDKIHKFNYSSNQRELSLAEMISNVSKILKMNGHMNHNGYISEDKIPELIKLLVDLEYVRPKIGWSKYRIDQRFDWKLFNDKFIKYDGTKISSKQLSQTFARLKKTGDLYSIIEEKKSSHTGK